MLLKSLAQVKSEIISIDVELILLPGLPQFHFLGLADQGIKELGTKIKSAIKQQGFTFPRAQQIIVNLRPSHVKKKSKGLDLAIALALLLVTKQIPQIYFYLSTCFFFITGKIPMDTYQWNKWKRICLLPCISQ